MSMLELADAASAWVAERVRESGTEGVVVGLSGGLDSAVSAALAVRGLGPGSVLGLVMPCRSLPQDTEDGLAVASHLGIRAREVDLTRTLATLLEDAGLRDADTLTEANVKSRLRMTALYAHAGGRLVLGTSNYSEYLVGYWTKWGDGAADIQPIGRLYKDEVRALGRVLGLPARVLSRKPSAGLWPGQTDEGEMGVTYDSIRDYFEGGSVTGREARRIGEMVRQTEHKREPVPVFDARRLLDEG